VRDSKKNLRLCRTCFSIAEDEECGVCRNPNRDPQTILVVADVRDLLAVEETGFFKGRYHVLGGLISPLQRVGPEKLRIAELKTRVAAGSIHEVILGTVPTAEGEVTAHYLINQLRESGVKITRIGAGIPVGGSLEYMDAMTVTKAILNRQEMLAADKGK
jgi:recombination protein RecR